MTYKTIPPTVSEDQRGQCDPHEVYNHPAYGVITLTNPQGGDSTLFGSDIGHNQRMCIRVHHAELKRDLNHDWIHTTGQIIEVEMSHAQFAQFITSQGKGDGTPCTLRWIRHKGAIPGIEKVETKHDTFRREIHDAARKRLEHIKKEIAKLGEMIESGKLPKKELRELHANLRHQVDYLPGTMEFVVKSAEEALEKATSDAKIEVESYIAMSAQRIGLKSINDLARLENHSAKILPNEGDDV